MVDESRTETADRVARYHTGYFEVLTGVEPVYGTCIRPQTAATAWGVLSFWL